MNLKQLAFPFMKEALHSRALERALPDFARDFTRAPPPGDAAHLYHTAPGHFARDIAEQGVINTFPPDYGTEQDMWPDRGTENRSYWTTTPGGTVPFAQDSPVLFRTPRSERFQPERGTADWFTREPVSPLEYYDVTGNWSPARRAR